MWKIVLCAYNLSSSSMCAPKSHTLYNSLPFRAPTVEVLSLSNFYSRLTVSGKLQ